MCGRARPDYWSAEARNDAAREAYWRDKGREVAAACTAVAAARAEALSQVQADLAAARAVLAAQNATVVELLAASEEAANGREASERLAEVEASLAAAREREAALEADKAR